MKRFCVIAGMFLLVTATSLALDPAGESGPTAGMVRMGMGSSVHGFPLQAPWPSTNGTPAGLTFDKLPVGFSEELGTNSSMVRMKLQEGEALWGFGERFDSLNMRGRTMESWIVDAWGGGNRSYICAPFFMSSAGYGVFVNCTGKVRFDCGATSTNELRIEVPEDGLDVFVFRGTPREILAQYTKLVGRPRPVPDWVFQPWISRNSYLSEYEIDRVIDKMDAYGLKAGAVVLEAWAENLQNFRFEQGRYPHPKEWIERLHGRGYHVVCWETPSLWDSASTYLEASTNGYLVLKPDGSELRVDWLENAVKIDFRKAAARLWWQKLQEPLVALGVDGFKTDGGERMPDPWFHNVHPYYYQQAALDAFQDRGKLGVTFARSATPSCAGDSTFWAGDELSTWDDLPRVARAGLSAALSGYPYWGHDIGGYSGTPTKDLYIRWLELGAFSPIMQWHGNTPREPWYYDDETMRIAKYYLDLRWRLQDYLKATAKLAREEGVPMWRPLLYEFPEDPATYNIDDEFFLGNDLLVAPVLTESGGRSVYLPSGDWVNAWTKEEFAGPKTFTVRVGLMEIPVFIRAEQAAHFDKAFPPLPTDTRGEVFVELAGTTNERGIVSTHRLLRGQKYEKIFLTAHDRGTNGLSGEVTLVLSAGFAALPGVKQAITVTAGGEARIAFYVSPPEKLDVGSYLVGVRSFSLPDVLTLTLIKPPQWQALGPFDGGVGTKFEGNLPTDLSAEYAGAGGRRVRWQPVSDDCIHNDGYVDFEKALGKENSGATTFGATTFHATRAGQARFYVGSGDALTIWLNGQLVFDKQVHRGAEADEDMVNVDLREGENQVLVKISRGIGPNGLYFRVDGNSS